MKNIWLLTVIRVRMALRSRTFLFFSLIMPLGFLFAYDFIFGKGKADIVGFLLGAVLGLTVMGSFWGLSMQLVQYREQGILRRFRLAPVSAGTLLASSLAANYILVMPTVVIEFLISRWVFHMQHWGDLLAVFLLVSVGACTFSAFGLIVASVTNTQQETQVINNLIWMAFLFLSGATIPLFILPRWIQRLSLFLPATFLVTGLQEAMLRTAGWRVMAGDLIALAVGLAAAFEISRQLFRWEPEAKISGRAKVWMIAVMIPFLLMGVWENVYGVGMGQLRATFQLATQSGTMNFFR